MYAYISNIIRIYDIEYKSETNRVKFNDCYCFLFFSIMYLSFQNTAKSL